jgi:hypothetical protein
MFNETAMGVDLSMAIIQASRAEHPSHFVDTADVDASRGRRFLDKADWAIGSKLREVFPDATVEVDELRLVAWKDFVGMHATEVNGLAKVDGLPIALRLTGFTGSPKRQASLTFEVPAEIGSSSAFARVPMGRTRLMPSPHAVEPLVIYGLTYEAAVERGIETGASAAAPTVQRAIRHLQTLRSQGVELPIVQ